LLEQPHFTLLNRAFREFFKANCLQSPHPHDPQHTARNDAISAAAPPPLAGNQGQEFGSLRIQSNGTNATHVEVHCKLLKHVYKAQCSPSIHQAADTVSLLLLVLLLAGLAANVLVCGSWIPLDLGWISWYPVGIERPSLPPFSTVQWTLSWIFSDACGFLVLSGFYQRSVDVCAVVLGHFGL
jgi:hypothetical protein